jgi:hypothetical protein
LRTAAAVGFGVVLALAGGVSAAGAAGETPTIQVVSALYGARHASRPFDFTDRLQGTCGAEASSCETFCTPAGTGARKRHHWGFGGRPICRVVYRCSDGRTKATEADEDDTLFLSCARAF